MKRMLALILSLVMCVGLFAGCGGSDGGDAKTVEGIEVTDKAIRGSELSYVMIYNPNVHNESLRINPKLSTGDFSSFVEAIISRADEVESGEEPKFITITPSEVGAGIELESVDLGGSRGGAVIVPYQQGETHEFYCGSPDANAPNLGRELKNFTCLYAGEYCNIWTFDSEITEAEAQWIGQEFDINVYNQMLQKFGDSRFAKNGGKVNFLFYDMKIDGLGGFFWPVELYASDELAPEEAAYYGVNTDHDILHMNTSYIKEIRKLQDDPEKQEKNMKLYVSATMAHEFQHLLCGTSVYSTIGMEKSVSSWFNEAMSGYVEEYFYPGSKEAGGHYRAFAKSDRVRHGQSMYNFDTDDRDIGVYGSVYLFSEFLEQVGGEDVFSDFYSYWRTSYSKTLDTAEALYNAVPAEVQAEIDSVIDYGTDISFDDKEEEWMSKLTLKFYLSLFDPNEETPEAYENVKAQTLLYDEINPADIEGGGRVIVALKEGEFEFPEDADDGLVYIGFNSDFEPITEFIIH